MGYIYVVLCFRNPGWFSRCFRIKANLTQKHGQQEDLKTLYVRDPCSKLTQRKPCNETLVGSGSVMVFGRLPWQVENVSGRKTHLHSSLLLCGR